MITVTATPDRSLVRTAGKSIRYLHLRLVAPPRQRGQTRAPVHVAFVIDRSGSMAGSRLTLAKQATSEALGFLGADDRFGVVTFDDHVDTLVPPCAASYAAVAAARERIARVEPGGSTALCEGWLTGAAHIDAGGDAVARCLLLTDGHANVGEAQPAALAHHASELRKRGVTTTTFGLGDNFSEELLHGMASAGGGHFYFIEHAAQIRDFFASELGEALEVVARDVTATITHPTVGVEPLVAYEVRRDADGASVRVGDLCADQVVELVVELTFPSGATGSDITLALEVAARDQAPVTTEVRFTFADHAHNDRQPRAVAVDRMVGAVYAADARRQAIVSNRAGDYAAAAHVLAATAKRIQSYAFGDPELVALGDLLGVEAQVFGKAMDEMSRKRAHHVSTSRMKGRDEQTGRAKKLS